MGDPPKGMSIERKLNSEGYTPENCVWATKKTQLANRSSTLWVITANGARLTASDAARDLGVTYNTFYYNLKRNGNFKGYELDTEVEIDWGDEEKGIPPNLSQLTKAKKLSTTW